MDERASILSIRDSPKVTRGLGMGAGGGGGGRGGGGEARWVVALADNDGEFRLNDSSTYGSYLRQNVLIWFGIETAVIITSQVCMNISIGRI